jgi:hypothetical protein
MLIFPHLVLLDRIRSFGRRNHQVWILRPGIPTLIYGWFLRLGWHSGRQPLLDEFVAAG